MISGIAHVNMLVPPGTLAHAEEFYAGTLGFKNRPVPKMQKDSLRWFDIGDSGQQVHIAYGSNGEKSPRHPCFKLESPEALLELRQKIYDHYMKGGEGAPKEADKPGEQSSGVYFRAVRGHLEDWFADLMAGAQGVEYPSRFFARDYAGNRLEFSL
jgi:hypothetical protein